MTCIGAGFAHLLEVALVRQSIQKGKPALRQACTYFRIALSNYQFSSSGSACTRVLISSPSPALFYFLCIILP